MGLAPTKNSVSLDRPITGLLAYSPHSRQDFDPPMHGESHRHWPDCCQILQRGVHYTARHLRPVISWVQNFPFNSPPGGLQLLEAGGQVVSCESGVLMSFLCLAPPPPLQTSPPRKKRQ
ncbi:jg14899 [Pararge aegeria aegeria]|uniref:Jg14899 protein n=1 Tax=Pararge aegeria aegeria TaxID=348720 RepID=A0A8S4R310_9NEOP|nr:jg14899 [Pararge aegeria aegeria]